MQLPNTSMRAPSAPPSTLRLVHGSSRSQGIHTPQLPRDMRDPRPSHFELDYLNWNYGDPLRRSPRAAAAHTVNNAEEVRHSARCGYAACGGTFAATAVRAWAVDGPEPTARCPFWRSDTLLADASGYPRSTEFRAALHDACG